MTLSLAARPARAPGLHRLRAAGARFAASCARRWFLDRDAEFWLRELGAPWTLAADRARVVEVIAETSDTRTLVLAPARRWPGHRAGQYAPVTVELDGARHTRCYTISSGGAPPGARRLAITVRHQPGGRVSAALHALRPGAWLGLGDPAGDFVLPDAGAAPRSAQVTRLGAPAGDFVLPDAGAAPRSAPVTWLGAPAGDFVLPDASAAPRSAPVTRLGEPAGDFVLPDAGAARPRRAPPKLLFVAGGSGVTPIRAMLHELARDRDAIVVHASRDAGDAIFGAELAALATRRAGLRVHAHHSRRAGRLDAAALARLVPDLADREVFVCGPPGLIELVEGCARAAGAPVHHERFVAAPAPPAGPDATITLLRGATSVVATGDGPLLVQLERAGQRPAHGCRIGICNTCRCRKRSGVVEDLTTGAISDRPDETIRLCTSRARSDLALDL
jgi:ferredoxin-NADP reductase